MRKVIFAILLGFLPCSLVLGVDYTLNSTLNQWNQNYTSNRPNATMRNFLSNSEYNEISPYLSNTMRGAINSGRKTVSRSAIGTTPTIGLNSSGLYLNNSSTGTSTARSATSSKGSQTSAARKVVSRSATTSKGVSSARSATTSSAGRTSSSSSSRTSTGTSASRNVISRSARTSATTTATTSSTNILAGEDCYTSYKKCMDNYCALNTSSYKRCFCSSRLATIEATYEDDIEELLNRIIILRAGVSIDEESNFSSIDNLETTLNSIDWAGMENQLRGTTAYETAKTYCIKDLTNCYYMSRSLEKSYSTEISNDCNSYENTLLKTKKNAQKIIDYLE